MGLPLTPYVLHGICAQKPLSKSRSRTRTTTLVGGVRNSVVSRTKVDRRPIVSSQGSHIGHNFCACATQL
jgi:hypothetical protein